MLKSDLIVEELALDSGIETKSKYESIDVSKIVLDEANSKKYHKDAGIYYTLTTDCFVNINKKKYDDLVKAFSNVIKEFLDWLSHYSVQTNFVDKADKNLKNKKIFNLEIPEDFYYSVVIYISGMTDHKAIDTFNEIISF